MKRHAWLIIVCLVFVGAGILRLNDLTLYTPDSIRYLIWGNSLAHGNGFVDDTQPDPDRYVVHAPFVSVILAPIEIIFPLSVPASKVLILFLGVVSLVVAYRWLVLVFGEKVAFIGTMTLAFNPLTVIYSTEILSEIPFLLCVFSIFFLCESLLREEQDSKLHFGMLIILLSIVPLIRDAGIALVGAVCLSFFFRKKTRHALALVLIPLAAYGIWYVRNEIIVGSSNGAEIGNTTLILQHFVTPSSSSLVNEFALRMWINVREYFAQVTGMMFFPLFSDSSNHLMTTTSSVYQIIQSFFNIGRYLVVLIGLPVLWIGIQYDWKTNVPAKLRLMFFAGYLLIVLLYPIHDIRFLFPLLPLLLFYAVAGFSALAKNNPIFSFLQSPRIANGLLLVVMIPNVLGVVEIIQSNIAYARSPVTVYEEVASKGDHSSYYLYPWSKFGDWLQLTTDADAVIASPSKELAAVAGGRKVLELNPGLPLPQFESELRDNRVGYILSPIQWEAIHSYLLLMRESKRFTFEPKGWMRNLLLFKVNPAPWLKAGLTMNQAAGDSGMMERLRGNGYVIGDLGDTASASALLLQGRKFLLSENYSSAEQCFAKALVLSPRRQELIFQHGISYEMLGDSANAMREFQTLLTLPQAGSAIILSRTHVEAMSLLSHAIHPKSYEEYAVKTLQASQFYWNLGYTRRAIRLLNGVFEKDSSYFGGLLWATHYNLQIGDTVRAKDYLGRLEKLDVANPVVQAFHRAISFGDSALHSNDNVLRSQLHLMVGKTYKQIELKEEAIDEAQLSLYENPKNTDAMVLLAQLFEGRSKYKTAASYYREVLEREPGNVYALGRLDTIKIKISQQ